MEWISVEERLPDEGTDVLVFTGFGRMDVLHIHMESYTICGIGPRSGESGKKPSWEPGGASVTHWMPLPEPPK